MKKLWLITLTLVMAVVLCLGLASCGKMEQLATEGGAILEGGGFKKGSTLNLNEISVTEEKANDILEQLAKSGIAIDDESKAYIYDIFVTNKKNEEVQPDGTVKVTIPAPADEKAEGYNVYHIKDSGAVENIPATLANGQITFETDGFSTYVLVPQYNVYTFYWNTQATIELAEGGKVQISGNEYTETATVAIAPGSSIALKAIPDAGYKFAGWVINAEGTDTVTMAEAECEYTMPYNNVKITASFKPVITDIDVIGIDEVYEYDPALLPELETISIADFINNGEVGKVYNVAGRVTTVVSGRIRLLDDEGNAIFVKLGNAYRTSLVSDYFATHDFQYITVTGTKGAIESGLVTIKNPTLHPVKEDFESAMVRGYSDVGTTRLKLGVDYEIIGEVNWEKAGEYAVVYRLIDDHSVSKSVIVKVLGEAIEFGAYVEGGTILIDGADIGPDFWEEYKEGFVKLTLTAKGEPNTVFRGWYTDEDTPRLISTESIYTFEFDTDTHVVGVFEYIPTGLTLDGNNAGFNTREDVTVIRLPANRTYNVNNILVYAIANGEPVWLEPGTYTVDAGGFNGTNPVKGSYTLTFSYKGMVKTHVIRVIDPDDMAFFSASAQAGGRVECDKPSGEYNKGEQITVTVVLRSESDYEFLGWYIMDASGAIGTTCLSTERTYSFTLNANTYVIAKVEPKITRLEVEGYEGEPTRIHLSKFWLADREIAVYACGALGKRVALTANEYTVDLGGLNLNAPVVGKYTITYTYKADTSITYTVTVWVYTEDHSFLATQDSPDNGWLIFNGELTHEAGGQYIEGEEITVVAAAKEGYTFLGWYRVIDHDTHATYELITTDATYTFAITGDTEIEARFGAPVTSIDLSGVGIDNYGRYFIEAFKGERINLSGIGVWASSLIDYRNLNSDEYEIDLGGLDLNAPAAGVYTVTFTYKEDGELTDVTVTLTVNVKKHVYTVVATVEGGDGYVEYEGNREQYVSADAEENSRVILKAGAYDPNRCSFLRWEMYNYDEDVWELYSTDSSISVVADGEVKLRAVFGGIVRELRIHENTNLYDKGVYHWNFDGNCWNEELGRYEEQGNLEISIDSEYVNDIAGLFANFHIVAVETNGRHTVINASDLVIDLGDYKAEEGWYEITVSYGSLTMTVNVMVVPAHN